MHHGKHGTEARILAGFPRRRTAAGRVWWDRGSYVGWWQLGRRGLPRPRRVPQSELVRAGTLDHVKVVRGDIRDLETLERLLGEYEIDIVIHLAARRLLPSLIATRFLPLNPISTGRGSRQKPVTVLQR